ncbi:MAG: MarC family protein [Burkholderiales bacterium]
MHWSELVKSFAALFAIMNPIGNMPIFLSVTDGKSPADRARIALTAAIAVAAILTGCILIGADLLAAFGISVAGLRTAGGLIILSIAYSLLHAKPSGMHHDADADPGVKESPAVYPLALPLLAGPGAIATVIVFAHDAHGGMAYAGLIGVVVVMAVLLFLGMRLAVPASNLLGTAGMNIITRVMGIILAAIAVEMIFAGARVLWNS